jgi:hypothetical protein
MPNPRSCSGEVSQCFLTRKRRWDTAAFSGMSANVVAPVPGWSVAQNYSYDKLNRVLSAEEPSISEGQGSKRRYNYDRWGDQWVDATNSSGINVFSVTQTGSASISPKNRINLSAGSYDRAGNQISLPPYSAAYDADNRLTISCPRIPGFRRPRPQHLCGNPVVLRPSRPALAGPADLGQRPLNVTRWNRTQDGRRCISAGDRRTGTDGP